MTTEYVILVKNGDAWTKLEGIAQARSAKAAIKDALDPDAAAMGGEFVAIPARSFRPVTVKVEMKTALRFS